MTQQAPWIERVQVSDYKSIATCDVSLGPLTVLVGPNASGKSNFLDAVAFLGDAVATSPYQAIETRGGMGEILRKAPESAESFRISVQVTVPWGTAPHQRAHGTYGFEIGRSDRRGQRPIEIIREWCQLVDDGTTVSFTVDRGEVTDPHVRGSSRIEPDRLYLPLASLRLDYAPLFGLLRGMRFYDLDPRILRRPATETESAVLGPDGEHLGDVIGQLADEQPSVKQRYDEYLAATVPGVTGLDRKWVSSYVTVEMRQHSQEFGTGAMSDGTIRAAGVLAALFQSSVYSGRVSLVGIEEPEVGLHPAAAGVLFDALSEASETVQVLATSQSADLLDREDAKPELVRVVTADNGTTIIGGLDEASQAIVGNRHFTVGELMRANQLTPSLGISSGDPQPAGGRTA